MTHSDLANIWSTFSVNECRGYSPLYERITDAVSRNDEVLDFLTISPPDKLHPNLLLAAVHDRVLRGLEPDLFDIYYNNSSNDVGEQFIACVLRSKEDLAAILLSRFVQTNEVGRVASLVPALASLELKEEATLIDVGTSAGLTLIRDLCLVDYGPYGTFGPADSPLRIECSVLQGDPPLSFTPIRNQIGFDRNPIDVKNADDHRWMRACVWPDTGRTERTQTALDLAAQTSIQFVKGDAVDDLPSLLRSVDGPLVVTTTWALVYAPVDKWEVFAQHLAEASVSRPVYWISAEAEGVVSALPTVEMPSVDGPPATVLGLVSYVAGKQVDARVLAHVHSHGKWLWWYD